MKIAYLVNQYPKGSHTFIRREIAALERQGLDVQRHALRGWDADVVDHEDRRERARTRYLLSGGAAPLAAATLAMLVHRPMRWVRALSMAVRLGRLADRPLAVHLVYFAEACLFVRRVESAGAHHVHAHFGTNATTVAMLAHALGGPPYSFTVHGPEEFDKPERIHLHEKIARAAFVVAVSAFGRSQLCRWAAHDDWPKLHVVHCGLEPAFHRVARRPMPDAPRLVAIGRLSEQKGQFILIEAVRILVRRGTPVEVALVGEGELRAPIERAIAAAGLSDRVSITGWIASDAVRDALLDARALVLPSFAEGLPIVCMEAMALHRPVIATWIAGIPELIRDGREGWLVPAGDATALADAIDRCLAMPRNEAEAMGDAAHARVLARHAIDVEAAKLHALFEAHAAAGCVASPAVAKAAA